MYLLDEESDTIEEVAEITDTVVKEVVPVVEVDALAEEEETKPKTIGRYTYFFLYGLNESIPSANGLENIFQVARIFRTV